MSKYDYTFEEITEFIHAIVQPFEMQLEYVYDKNQITKIIMHNLDPIQNELPAVRGVLGWEQQPESYGAKLTKIMLHLQEVESNVSWVIKDVETVQSPGQLEKRYASYKQLVKMMGFSIGELPKDENPLA
jgi:hypothetical protein